jgi:hypothetical protein
MEEPFSKQSNGIPRALRTWAEAMPEDPAPITQTRWPSPSAVAGFAATYPPVEKCPTISRA